MMDPDSISKLNPRRIYELARDNPIIAIALNSWEQGFYSWEQMLIYCITVLVEVNERLKQDNIDLISRNVRPVIIKYEGKRRK